MKDIKERIAVNEQVSASAHKRLDRHEAEISSLRESRHSHSNIIQKHEGAIDSHAEILRGIKDAVRELTEAVFGFKVMAATALFMGSAFITFCGFVGGKLLNWW